MAIIASLPGDEPHEYNSPSEAATAMQAELVGKGQNPHQDITVAIPLGGTKVALISVPLDDIHKLDKLMRGYD